MITILEKPIPFGGGISLPPNKTISLEQPLIKAKLSALIKIPLRQHIKSSAMPVVKVGEKVFKGQLIAKARGYISTPIHASTSGIVREIAEHAIPNPSATMSPCIVIETDGNETWLEDKTLIDNYYSLSPVETQQKIFRSGIVDLGGSGFPSAVKITSGLTLDIELLIINAAESEPYISCNETLIRNNMKEVVSGIEVLAHALQANEVVIAIEENKNESIDIIKQTLEKYAEINIKLILISSLYPADGEKQLIKSITGIEIPAKSLPLDIGVVVYNIGTAVAVKKAIIDDEPLISRIVTVTGTGINQACNIEVLIGTPINEIIEQCGGYNDQFKYLIVGGPMKGFGLHSDHVPLTKTTNCLLAAGSELQTMDIKESSCIRCDECAAVCPVNLQPQQLHWHLKESNTQRLQDFHLFDCIECGCCFYVCPSRISLVDEFRQAKSNIRAKRYKQLEADQNRKRYLDKQVRMEQQKKDKIEKRSTFIDEKASADLVRQKKREIIAAAVNRVKQKRKIKDN